MLMLLLLVALIVSWECTVYIQYILPVCLHVEDRSLLSWWLGLAS